MRRYFLAFLLNIVVLLPNAFSKDFEITVIDSAIDFNHLSLVSHRSQFGSFDPYLGLPFENNWDPKAEKIGNWFHGTHVAGIIAQHFDAEKFYTPKINNIFYIQSTDTDEELTPTQIQEKDDRAFSNITKFLEKTKPKIVNLSFGEDIRLYGTILSIAIAFEQGIRGNYLSVRKLNRLIKKQFNRDMKYEKEKWTQIFRKFPDTLFVIAAGNEGRLLSKLRRFNFFLPRDLGEYSGLFYEKKVRLKGYKACIADINLDNTITVGSWSGESEGPSFSEFSNYGSAYVDILADGENVYSFSPGSLFEEASGTSMAAPQISGLAASILQDNVDLSPKELKNEIFKRSKQSIKFFGKSRYGRYYINN